MLTKIKNNKNLVIITSVAVFIVVVVLVAAIANNRTVDTIEKSGNTVVDSYRIELPTLAAEVESKPNNATALRNYAVALYATGDLESAKEQYLKEKNVNPNDPTLYNNLGNIYRDNGEYQNAVDAYQKSIDLNKDQLNVYANLANLYIYILKQPDLGYGVYLKGIDNSPKNQEGLLMQLANAYRDAGLKDKAKETYNKILTINPNNQTVKTILQSLN